jgi:cytochrome c oxidase cbb3-type subunit 3
MSKINSENDVVVTDCEPHDGIVELDNNLPNWWLWTLYVSIIFSIGYMYYYHVSGRGILPVAAYLEEQKTLEAQKPQEPLGPTSITDEELRVAIADPTQAASGKQVFDIRCIACHAPGGAGTVGPNLTDDYWLHGGKPSEIVHTIQKGVPEKGMISWEAVLPKSEIIAVVSYIASIHGSNPPNAKAPQGDKLSP